MNTAGKDNKVIHGMWIGTELSRLEQLTIRSFVKHGHEFCLWVYDDISTPLPVGASLRDANEIIPSESIFRNVGNDHETGVGRGSLGAFSDLFRYKLLYEHGGIWVDMDVTCLRPFDFSEEYVFRPHRIGVVGSIIKSPKGSQLMRDTYQEAAAYVNAQTEWLAANRVFAKNVERLNLERYIKPNLSNNDSWVHVIQPFIEKFTPIPDEWYAIHWINEFWRTLKADAGYYRGTKLLDYVPDKETPAPGSTLHELYRKFGLLDPWQKTAVAPTNGAARKSAPGPQLTREGHEAVGLRNTTEPSTHFNVLLPSIVRGGAERAVLETRESLRTLSGTTQALYVFTSDRLKYPLEGDRNAPVIWGEQRTTADASFIRSVALGVLQSPVPAIYTHLIRAKYLQHLWSMGVTTIPVVQNARPSWLDPPSAYNNPRVPFVVAVADAVADQLRESGCEKPVLTIRHELQRWFKPEELARNRKDIRDKYGINDDVILLGMVGQFKSQKAYTRAVRVLHTISRSHPAKLMILGGWDHEYGSGRTAYEATCRLAVELGVIADMITPGDVHPVDPYFAAFDVFLNTSVFEGLSVALLEAIQTGCPIVSADAGGNREVLPQNAFLVKDSSDISAYVEGISEVLRHPERVVPSSPPEPSLVPRLWCLLAKHGVASSVAQQGAPNGTLFLTQNLNVGGPQRSLVNLLSRIPKNRKIFLGVMDGVFAGSPRDALDAAQVSILSCESLKGTLDRVEQILRWVDKLNVWNVCFWNLHPEIKLLLAKVLTARKTRLIDVSPGPNLFDELDASDYYQRRISMTAAQYFERLDCFVSKYPDGVPTAAEISNHSKVAVIANGVPMPPNFVPLPPPQFMLPSNFDPEFAIGTCCRIVPDKEIEFLIDMMKSLKVRVPQATLTVVGGPDSRSAEYRDALVSQVNDSGLNNIFFVGRHEDVNPFLSQFKVFVLTGNRHGCPNASLEAMAMKRPVVATRNPSTIEQIENGVNGFLVSEPAEAAARVELLLSNRHLRTMFGEAGCRLVRERFSMEQMLEKYLQILDNKQATPTLHANGHLQREGRLNGSNPDQAQP